MNSDPTLADYQLAVSLEKVVEGLPIRCQTETYHSLHQEIHFLASGIAIKKSLGYEASLIKALSEVIPNPRRLNSDLLSVHRSEVVQASLTSFKCQLLRRSQVSPYEPLPWNRQNLLTNDPRLIQDVETASSLPASEDFCWPIYLNRPGCYLGSVITDNMGIFAFSYEVHRGPKPLCEQKLMQLGRLFKPVMFGRVVSFYAVEHLSIVADCIATQEIWWNDHEALIFPVQYVETPTAELQTLGTELMQLSEAWLTSQGVEHFVELDPDELDRASSLRALVDPEYWEDWNIAPPPERLMRVPKPAAISFGNKTINLPHLSKLQLTALLLLMFVALVCGLHVVWPYRTDSSSVANTAQASSDQLNGMLSPPQKPREDRGSPSTGAVVALVVGFLFVFLGLLAAFVWVIKNIVDFLHDETPIGKPIDKRHIIYVGAGGT